MASTAVGTALTERHRRRQLILRDATVKDIRRIWPALDFTDIDAITRSWSEVEPLLARLVTIRYRASAGLASAYVRGFRAAEGIPGNAIPQLAAAIDAEQVLTSIRVTGLYTARDLLAKGADGVVEQVLTRLTGSAARLTLTGGRRTIIGSVEADEQALGYARVTDGKPCAFCAMLAGRGPIYRSAMTADFDAHDHCGCAAEPTYRADQPWPGRAREYQSLWQETTSGLAPGDDPAVAFRRAIEGR